jgi:hypothetical protein
MEVVLVVTDGVLPVAHLEYLTVTILDVQLAEEDEQRVDCEVAGFELEVLYFFGRSLECRLGLDQGLSLVVNHVLVFVVAACVRILVQTIVAAHIGLVVLVVLLDVAPHLVDFLLLELPHFLVDWHVLGVLQRQLILETVVSFANHHAVPSDLRVL